MDPNIGIKQFYWSQSNYNKDHMWYSKEQVNLIETYLHLTSAVLILIALTIPAYLSLKLQGNLRMLTGFLAVFLFAHALYHVAGFIGFELGERVFEPLSAILLVVFGVVYLKTRKVKQEIKT